MSRITSLFRELGLLNAVLYALSRLLKTISSSAALYKYYFFAQPVYDGPLVPSGRGTTIEVRLVPKGDASITCFPRPSSVIMDRYAQGCICLAAFCRNEFAGFIWLSCGPYQEDEVCCRYAPGPPGRAAWDFDVYIEPKFRLGWTLGRLWDEANIFLKEKGIKWSMSRISSFNSNSIQSHSRMGAALIASAVFIRFGRVQYMLSTIAPYIHVSTGDHSYPTLMLQPQPFPKDQNPGLITP